MNALKVVIKAILISCTDQMTVARLEHDYKTFEGCDLPYRKLGYDSLDEMLRCDFQDIVKVHGFGSQAILTPINYAKSEHIAKLVNEQRRPQQKQIRRLHRSLESGNLNRNPDFVRYQNRSQGHHVTKNHTVSNKSSFDRTPRELTETKVLYTARWVQSTNFSLTRLPSSNDDFERSFPSKYDEDNSCSESQTVETKDNSEYNRDEIRANESNCISNKIEEVFEETPELKLSEVTVVGKNKDDENVSSSNSSSSGIFYKPKKNKNKLNDDAAIPDFAFDNRIFFLDFPKFTVKFGTKIKPPVVPQDIKVDSIISIYISQIHNPYKFWFHLFTESHKLDQLMSNIEHFYERIEINYHVPLDMIPEHIQAGQICAATFNGLWHRAEILTNYITNNKVKVNFIDYGTVCDVEISSIKYLHSEFQEFASFANRGCLAEIIPVRLHWTTESSMAFLSMCNDRLVHAKVCEIDVTNRVYYLTICDTHGEKVVQINRKLIQLNHAFKSLEWSKSRKLEKPRRRHKRENYPTFDMLEKNEYPSLSELMEMEQNNIPYESMTDKMIYSPRILNFEKDTAEVLSDLPFLLLSNNPFARDIISTIMQNSSQVT